MTLFVNDDDRFGESPRAKNRGIRISWRVCIILFLVITVCAGLAWYFLRSPRLQPGDLPFIRADEEPYKIRSQDKSVPGVQHQDKLIYRRLRKEDGPPPVEHILPDSESIKMIEPYLPHDINPEAPSISIEDIIGETEDQEEGR